MIQGASEIDILWLIACAALVFLMQGGFLCLEAGLTRSKNVINVAFKNLSDFGIALILFWAVGFGLIFGAQWMGVLGYDVLDSRNQGQLAAFFLFQAVFCGTTVTILSGAVAERMRYRAYLILAMLISALVYPVVGGLIWGGMLGGPQGLLAQIGFIDFAGTTVVHSVGGWAALAAVIVIGARQGRFGADGKVNQIPASNMSIAVLGVILLWIGWIGFNGGSTIHFSAETPGVIVRTMLAGSAGLVAGIILGRWRYGYHHPLSILNGSLAGLVAITGCVHAVSASQSLFIGAVGAGIALAAEKFLEKLKIDDAIGVVPVHLAAGIWGTLALGLFGDLALVGTGLSRLSQIGVQLVGVVVVGALCFPAVWVSCRILKQVGWLRVSSDQEVMGLNVAEHRASSEIADFVEVIDHHRRTHDFSRQAPEEPFTWVGQVAKGYNRLIGRLEDTQIDLDNLRISERKLNEQQAKLREQAMNDPLTGLYNRAGFHESINEMMGAARKNARLTFALVFMDLDKFKIINDGMGHETGDQLLVITAQRIKGFIQELPPPGSWSIKHSATRLGGDEFALLLASPENEQEAADWCEQLREKIEQPIDLETKSLTVTVSIGVAMVQPTHLDPSDLVRDADTAMYAAKRNGRNCISVFDATMREQGELRLALTQELREALHNDEFRVHYQPINRGSNGELLGFEALVRWQHHSRGMISPNDFIPIAEETGVIKVLGRWIFRRCIHQLSEWQAEHPNREEPLWLSINLSRRDLIEPDLLDYLRDLTKEYGVAPETIHLEITEGSVMFDPNISTDMLERLQEAGFHISIDDFGTGYSSLGCLHDIPFNTLKIDKSFLGEATNNIVKAAVLEHIVSIAHAFEAKIIAEGVETIEHVDMLKEMKCDMMQGFFFSRPLPQDQATELLKRIQLPTGQSHDKFRAAS
ncbi:MAG: ammonium transporter [Phycisphaeraceae bacterium]